MGVGLVEDAVIDNVLACLLAAAAPLRLLLLLPPLPAPNRHPHRALLSFKTHRELILQTRLYSQRKGTWTCHDPFSAAPETFDLECRVRLQ